MYLGIDLGTSNSAIVGNEKGRMRLFKTVDGRDVLPSMIYVDRRGQRFVGSKAYDQALLSPQNVAQGFKRLMGTKTPLRFEASGEEVSPEDASAEILRTLLAQARSEAGDFEIEGAVITVPAAFNQMQSEATIRAAASSGLERTGLLQEPIAAALASLEGAKGKDAQFLVYDLGGGTLDVALVRSVKGTVTIIAHEGINLLGGRDFDKAILNSVVRPWLLEHYDLPEGYQKEAVFQRLIRLAQLKAEEAKIELSTRETATIFVSEDEARATDRSGRELFIEIPLRRQDLDQLVADRIEDSLELCRKVLNDNGLTNDDIDRVVLIGGPSKMPAIRDRLPRELGIPADLGTDPMTAVARGAAIYAESRLWGDGRSERKPVRASKQTRGQVKVRYEYEARTAGDQIRIKAVPEGDASGLRVSAVTANASESGEMVLDSSPMLKVPLEKDGENLIKVIVTDARGTRVEDACAELVVTRVGAASAGIPLTHTISVKTVTGQDSRQVRNILTTLIKKGALLPQSGKEEFRAANSVSAGTDEHIDIEIFQQTDGVLEPELNLFIGAIRLGADLLEEHQAIRRGDEIRIHWKVDDNGLLTCSVELVQTGVRQDRQFYIDELGQQNFAGEGGHQIAGGAVLDAERDVDNLDDALGSKAASEIAFLRRRLQRQLDALSTSDDSETHRSISEEARHIRQEVSILKHNPRFRRDALQAELNRNSEMLADVMESFDQTAAQRAQQLVATAKSALRQNQFDEAERAIEDLKDLIFTALRRQPAFIEAAFDYATQGRHLAVDAILHDRLASQGQEQAAAGDYEGLNQTTAAIYRNRADPDIPDRDIAALAGLMRR